MTENAEPAMTVEKRLDKIGEDLLRVANVQTTQGEDLRKLRVLYEHHDTQIQRIAEVQVDHGRALGEHGELLKEHGELLRAIDGKLAPLNDFVRRIAGEHEARISTREARLPVDAPTGSCAPRRSQSVAPGS